MSRRTESVSLEVTEEREIRVCENCKQSENDFQLKGQTEPPFAWLETRSELDPDEFHENRMDHCSWICAANHFTELHKKGAEEWPTHSPSMRE